MGREIGVGGSCVVGQWVGGRDGVGGSRRPEIVKTTGRRVGRSGSGLISGFKVGVDVGDLWAWDGTRGSGGVPRVGDREVGGRLPRARGQNSAHRVSWS